MFQIGKLQTCACSSSRVGTQTQRWTQMHSNLICWCVLAICNIIGSIINICLRAVHALTELNQWRNLIWPTECHPTCTMFVFVGSMCDYDTRDFHLESITRSRARPINQRERTFFSHSTICLENHQLPVSKLCALLLSIFMCNTKGYITLSLSVMHCVI